MSPCEMIEPCFWLSIHDYHAKDNKRGESTFFRHMDVNIPEVVPTKKKKSMQQVPESASPDDENDKDCTGPNLGMHKDGNINTW